MNKLLAGAKANSSVGPRDLAGSSVQDGRAPFGSGVDRNNFPSSWHKVGSELNLRES